MSSDKRKRLTFDTNDIYINDSTIRVFISYRNMPPSEPEAGRLADDLSKIGMAEHNIFFDQKRLQVGDIWQQKIFDNIRQCDVLIVLLQAGDDLSKSTAKSEWVQREVDVARGCHVSILPIKLYGESEQVITREVTQWLAINDRQFMEYCSLDYKIEYHYIMSQLDPKYQNTHSPKPLSSQDKQKLEDKRQQAILKLQNYDNLDEADRKQSVAELLDTVMSDKDREQLLEDEKQQDIKKIRDKFYALDEKKRTEELHNFFHKTMSEDERKDVQDEQRQKFSALINSINLLSHRTRDAQSQWIEDLELARRTEHSANNHSAYQIVLKNSKQQLTVHMATGDMTEFDTNEAKIDVIVNSENDYMQLSRMHQLNSLSVSLRFKAARFENGRLMDDRLQNELNEQVMFKFADQGLPLALGQVIPTFAGDPCSVLRGDKGYRYIFHAATIHFDAIYSDTPFAPINTSRGIREIVSNCLDLVEEVNHNNGIILDPKSRYSKEQDAASGANYTPIKSIIFPLFSTGQAGRPVADVIDPLLQGIQNWFILHPNTNLENVYVSVYSKDHRKIVQSAMDDLVTGELFNNKSESTS